MDCSGRQSSLPSAMDDSSTKVKTLASHLPREIWEKYLCYYLNENHYEQLWSTMDRRIHALLNALSLDCMVITDLYERQSPVIVDMAKRAKRRFEVSIGKKSTIGKLQSDATIIVAKCGDVSDPLSFASWPNLQSLDLVNTRRVTDPDARFSLTSLVSALPSNLTRLCVRDDRYTTSFVRTVASSALEASDLICVRLPNLVDLLAPSFVLSVPSNVTRKCKWPIDLRRFSISIRPPTGEASAIDFNLPSTLTEMELYLSFSTMSPNSASAYVETSSLPASLCKFAAPSFAVKYDVPLPRALEEFACASLSPTYRDVDFPLPRTLKWLIPAPSVAESLRHGANIRILAHYDGPVASEGDVESDWSDVDDILGVNANRTYFDSDTIIALRHAANAFCAPKRWHYWDVLGERNLFGLLLPRIARTLVDTGVSNPNYVWPILELSKWLRWIQLLSVDATRTFFDYAIDALSSSSSETKSDRLRMPHLLDTITLCLSDETSNMIDFLSSVPVKHPSVRLETVRTARVYIDLARLSKPDLGKSLAAIFPNVTSMTVSFSTRSYYDDGKAPKFISANELKSLLEPFKRLTSIEMTHTGNGIKPDGFVDPIDAYVEVIPPQVKQSLVKAGKDTISDTISDIPH